MLRKLKRYISQKWCTVTNTYWRTYRPFKSIKRHLENENLGPCIVPHTIIIPEEHFFKSVYFSVNKKSIVVEVTKKQKEFIDEPNDVIEYSFTIPLDSIDSVGQFIETITALQQTATYIYKNRKKYGIQ